MVSLRENRGGNELQCIYPKCTAALQKQKTGAPSAARASKRKSTAPGGAGSSKKAQSGAAKVGKSGSWTRLTQDQKVEILALLTQGVTHDTIANDSISLQLWHAHGFPHPGKPTGPGGTGRFSGK